MSYSWIPFYREVAGVVLGYENRQSELIALLREMKLAGFPTIPLEDNQTDGTQSPLAAIDPFTFMANFSRVGDEQAKKLCQWLKTKWTLTAPTPTDFEGRANVEAQNSWFFPSVQKGRTAEDISSLWQLARQAYGAGIGEVDATVFQRCLQINNVAIRKLSAGLFWLSPKGFLPLVGPVLPYLKERGVEFDSKKIDRGDFNEYRTLMEKAREVSFDNAEISHDAWKWGKAEPVKAEAPLAPLPQFPLNQILYGPPGTGKTYNAIPRAVEIITGETFDDRAECQLKFDDLRRKGKIGFVTFHQSFSYEEFIEGLRPRLEDEDGQVSYEVRDGVLKDIALNSIKDALKKTIAGKVTFDEVWDTLLANIESGPEYRIAGLSPESAYQLTRTAAGNLQAKNVKSELDTTYSCPRRHVLTVWNAYPDSDKVSSTEVRKLVGNSHNHLIGAVFNELKLLATIIRPNKVDDISIDDVRSFLDGSSEYSADFQNSPRYVLIIDEINRGNISKILGELITLLEDDKRLGTPNELRVTLPVSLETFALPPNLYILGTMNTADKSLALLDIALRRRFEFEEIRPDFGVTKLPAEMKGALEMLNLRLEAALDREHCLGHAYFRDVQTPEQFNAVFRTKIIPLLQEFFYNDWETLRAVLGDSGSKGFIRELPQLKGLKNRTKWRWWFDVKRDEPLDCLEVLSGNYNKLGASVTDDDSDG